MYPVEEKIGRFTSSTSGLVGKLQDYNTLPMYGAGLRLLRFFFLKRIIALAVLLWKQLFQIFHWLAGNIFNSNTLADVGGVVRIRRTDRSIFIAMKMQDCRFKSCIRSQTRIAI